MGLTAEEYLSALQALLPPGAAWTREPDAELSKLLQAWADEFARLDARAKALLDEADPSSAVELLPDWETICSLDGTGTEADRQAALGGHLNATGGVSGPYFTGLAEDLGVSISITRYKPFKTGWNTVGEALTNGDWIYTWRVIGPVATSAEIKAALETLFEAEKPAHTIVIFDWSS
ncbi:MAG: DUF2313 domain-containing protein [Deltaproteobacteria bacterium]|nr:DUF2313 domain-containing protein [Deltaproteobacteria bacterium]